MPLHFFRVPVMDSDESQTVLNQFLAQHSVLDVDRQLIVDGQKSHWAVCVTTAALASQSVKQVPKLGDKKRESIDYKLVLSPDDFAVYAVLRELRKQVAEAEGVPAYVVFTNAQLASMVTEKVKSKSALAAITGVGQARVNKHADIFVKCLLESHALE